MKKINIALRDNPYEVIIGDGLLGKLGGEIKKRDLYKNLFVFTDSNVERIYGAAIRSLLHDWDGKLSLYSFPAGEASKNIDVLQQAYRQLISEGFGRDTLIIAFGGGVVGDMAGFLASTYMRGVQLIQVPTTLLAAVDSSVGGKTGIDFMHVKNVIGTFYQPRLVLIDTNLLNTLPREEILCGMGEIMKYAMLSGSELFDYVKKNSGKVFLKDPKVLGRLIMESVGIKSAVVLEDEKESGLRKILNLGHTFAHAYESVMNYELKHGEAVIAGLACAADLSKRLGLLDEKLFNKYIGFIGSVKVSVPFEGLDNQALYSAMLKDKKNRNGKIKFVLPASGGEILLDVEADRDNVIKTLQAVSSYLSAR